MGLEVASVVAGVIVEVASVGNNGIYVEVAAITAAAVVKMKAVRSSSGLQGVFGVMCSRPALLLRGTIVNRTECF